MATDSKGCKATGQSGKRIAEVWKDVSGSMHAVLEAVSLKDFMEEEADNMYYI